MNLSFRRHLNDGVPNGMKLSNFLHGVILVLADKNDSSVGNPIAY